MPKKADIYTRTGDKGQTGLFGGGRVDKDDLKVEAYGTMDEFCAVVSAAKASGVSKEIFEILSKTQEFCHTLNAEVASDEKGKKLLKNRIDAEAVAFLEEAIDRFDAHLKPLNHFIVPEATMPCALLNLARTVCRRAERRIIALSRREELSPEILKFMNRLSDLMFTLLRYEGEFINN